MFFLTGRTQFISIFEAIKSVKLIEREILHAKDIQAAVTHKLFPNLATMICYPTAAAKHVHPNSRTAPQGKAGHFQDLGHSSTFIGWHELHHQSRLQIIRHILRRYRTLPAPHPQASRTTWPPFRHLLGVTHGGQTSCTEEGTQREHHRGSDGSLGVQGVVTSGRQNQAIPSANHELKIIESVYVQRLCWYCPYMYLSYLEKPSDWNMLTPYLT